MSIPLWNHLRHPANEKQLFISLDQYHHSIHVDSEHKVINTLPKQFQIRDENIIVGKRGRGSNFALGYNGLKTHGDEHMLENCLEAIRKETERCDIFTGSIVCHSLSGGTGSGMGCRIIETLRDEHPCRNILSCAVLPCASGESSLQNYNSLLALSWLQNFTDAALLLLNDSLISRLSHKLQNNSHTDTDDRRPTTKPVTFKSMNQLAANQLYGAFGPTNTLLGETGLGLGQEPWELVRTLATMPSHKFITLNQHISSKMSWAELVSKNLQQHPKLTLDEMPTKCLAATVIARGDKSNTFLSAVKRGLDKRIQKSLKTVSWNPYPLDLWTSKTDILGNSGSSSVTMATNSSSVLNPLETVVYHSSLKLESGAYMHWYQRHGISRVCDCLYI